MSVEISITINDSKQPLSSLGKAARELSSGGESGCEHSEECNNCDLDSVCADCGNCVHCQGECPECGQMDEMKNSPSSLGATAKQYSKDGIRKSAIDIFDLRKEDRSNEYEDPEKTGKRSK